jgi:hypothetical protein
MMAECSFYRRYDQSYISFNDQLIAAPFALVPEGIRKSDFSTPSGSSDDIACIWAAW